VQGGGNTSGSASNDDNAHLACSSHTDWVMSSTTLMSSLSSTVDISSPTTRWTSQTGSHWAKALPASCRSKTQSVEEVPGLTPFARFVTLPYPVARVELMAAAGATVDALNFAPFRLGFSRLDPTQALRACSVRR
jgi:hypothetical protein